MNKLKTKRKNVIDEQDWNDLVQKTYKRVYNFQQQDGCKERGTFYLTVPDEADDYKNTSVKEVVNGPEEGVSFAAWLARDPKQELADPESDDVSQWETDLWWERNFYPDIQMVANDLHNKGILPAGDYVIDINW